MKRAIPSSQFVAAAKTASLAAALFLSVAVLSSSTQATFVDGFQPTCQHYNHGVVSGLHKTSFEWGRSRRRSSRSNDFSSATAVFSSIGGGGNDRPPPPPDNSGSDGGNLGDFLDPMRKPESENLKRAREFMSETSLPLSFDTDDDHDDDEEDEEDAVTPTIDTTSAASSSLTSTSKFNNSASSSALFGTDGSPSSDLLAKNPYMQVVSKISPSEVIAKFTATADPRVQEAVRTTILGLIGSLPKLAFETTSITTGQRLASLVSAILMISSCSRWRKTVTDAS
jgi:Protein of unknown function (DUF760)